jgi:hypothetical protein
MGWARSTHESREKYTQFETENLQETERGLEDNIKTHLRRSGMI